MKIEDPVKLNTIKYKVYNRYKYKKIYDKVLGLQSDEALPITFDSRKEARMFQIAAHKANKCKVIIRNNIAYAIKGKIEDEHDNS